MQYILNRRTLIVAAGAALPGASTGNRRQVAGQAMAWSPVNPPIGREGEIPGAGFRIDHGFQCENTNVQRGWWHTAEDWYAREGETAGALVYAVADGEVVFSGYDYPGLVVIVRHADDLSTSYGHLDREPMVREGDSVRGGDVIGTVLLRTDGIAPSHLHYEARTFLFRDDINGDNPQYGVNCGQNCAPGPGYWPIDAPDLPADLGWLNPTHVQAALAIEAGGPERFLVTAETDQDITLRAEPDASAEAAGEVTIGPETSLDLFDIAAGEPDTRETSAEAYDLWFRVGAEAVEGWAQAAVPSDRETGSDGRPSTVERMLLLVPRPD